MVIWAQLFLSRVQPALQWIKNKGSWLYLFIQYTDPPPISAVFSSSLIKNAHQLRANANTNPFYFCLSPQRPQRWLIRVQHLAWSLKPFPPSLPYKTPMAQWLSASAVPSLGHEDWFSFFLQVEVQSMCPLPTTQRDHQYNARINLKNSCRGSLSTTSVLPTRLSAPSINEGKPC